MNDRQQEPELRARFEAQRHADAARAPSFADMLSRAQAQAATDAGSTSRPAAPVTALPTRRTPWRRYRTGALAAAAIAALIIVPRMRSGDDAFEQAVRAFQSDPALGAWQSPTDGLLSLPGDRLLSTIPTVGTGPQ